MGKPDISLKVWLGNPARFADLFNAILFKGKHIIDASELEVDKSEYDLIVKDKKDSQKALQSFRDIVMCWNNEYRLVILACENQELINYGMPIRNMLYDSMAYSEQVQQINNRINMDVRNNKTIPDIYYSRELNLHKLVPVITLVLYYGNEEWDAPLELYDMLDMEDDSCKNEDIVDALKQYVPNYKINLVVPSKIEDYSKFTTDLQPIFNMLKYKQNKVLLKECARKYPDFFKNIPKDTMDVLKILLKTGKRFDKKLEEVTIKEKKEDGKEKYDFMCIFDEIYEDGVEYGIEQGIKNLIEVMYDNNFSADKIIQALMEKYNLSVEIAKVYVDRYAQKVVI